jgi:hypothetical protein
MYFELRHRLYYLRRANVNGFRTFREKLIICGPNSPPKFQPSIRNKSARIKLGLKSITALIREDLLQTEGWNFLVSSWDNKSPNLRVGNPLTFAHSSIYTGGVKLHKIKKFNIFTRVTMVWYITWYSLKAHNSS